MVKYLPAILFLVTLCLSLKETSSKEVDNSNKTFELSLRCRQNQTGHWNTHLLLNTTYPKLPKSWKFDMKFSSSESNGLQLFNLMGLLTVPPPRPADYELFPGIGYYKFYPQGSAGFSDASSICSRDGGHLVILNSEAESKVIQAIYARHPKAKDFAFIGIHDMIEGGKFFTIFGEPLASTGFTRWVNQEQPDNAGGNENCGSVHRSGSLNDVGCGGNWPFFCEYDLSWSDQ